MQFQWYSYPVGNTEYEILIIYVETLTLIGEVWGLLSKDLPCSHLGKC